MRGAAVCYEMSGCVGVCVSLLWSVCVVGELQVRECLCVYVDGQRSERRRMEDGGGGSEARERGKCVMARARHNVGSTWR